RDPPRIRRPGREEGLDGAVDNVRTPLFRDARLDVEPIEHPRVVDVRDLLAVGGPAGELVVAGSGELEAPYVPLAILRLDVELVLAGLVREIGDPPAVGRPDRRALVDGRRVG